MKKLISVTVILLFIGLAFAPSINANVRQTDIDASKESIPLELQYHQIIDKIKSINLQKLLFDLDVVIDTLEEISITLEENEDLRIYAQMQSDCGCEGTTKWPFPVICALLFPLFWLSFWVWSYTRNLNPIFLGIMFAIGEPLNCFWTWI